MDINEDIRNTNTLYNLEIPEIENTKNIQLDEKDLFRPIGILDPEGKELNPLTQEPYQNLYTEAEKFPNTYSGYAMGSKGWSEYKTYKSKEEILTKLYNKQVILVTAGTGAGKTVLVPKFLLHVLNYQGNIAITIPRTEPTISAAEYSAKCLDVELGTHVGYSTQFNKNKSEQTKLLYTTDGTILAKLNGDDPYLEKLDGLIIDEAHERNANIDQILLLVKKVLTKRPEFKLVIMSATIEPKIFMEYYKEFNIDHVDLPMVPNYNVEEIWLKEKVNIIKDGNVINKAYIQKTAEIIWKEILLPGKEGDILALLPSAKEGVEICQLIQNYIKEEKKKNNSLQIKPFCIKLEAKSRKEPYGSEIDPSTKKPYTEKNYAIGSKDYKNINKTYTRRIIMATEVAESSITFDGDPINFVIDTGLAHASKYYPNEQLEALEKKYIARANHIQRKGRTGRKQEGVCYNVFTKEEYNNFLEWPIPKIMNENIISIILSFMRKPYITHVDIPFSYPTKRSTLENKSLNEYLFEFIGLPEKDYIDSALLQLEQIGAIEVKDKKGTITEFGKAVQMFERESLSPQQAATILHSYNYRCSDEVMNIVALLSKVEGRFGNIFNQNFTKEKNKKSNKYKEDEKKYIAIMKKNSSSYGDIITLHKILETYKKKQYIVSREKGREKLQSRESNATGTSWAKENFIRANNLKDAVHGKKTKIEGIKKIFGMCISRYKDVIQKNVVTHDKIEENIIQSFVNGYTSHIIQSNGRDYMYCSPKEKTFSMVGNKESMIKYVKQKPPLCIQNYYFKSITGMKFFGCVTRIPPKVKEQMTDIAKDIIKNCKKNKKTNTQKISFLQKTIGKKNKKKKKYTY